MASRARRFRAARLLQGLAVDGSTSAALSRSAALSLSRNHKAHRKLDCRKSACLQAGHQRRLAGRSARAGDRAYESNRIKSKAEGTTNSIEQQMLDAICYAFCLTYTTCSLSPDQLQNHSRLI